MWRCIRISQSNWLVCKNGLTMSRCNVFNWLSYINISSFIMYQSTSAVQVCTLLHHAKSIQTLVISTQYFPPHLFSECNIVTIATVKVRFLLQKNVWCCYMYNYLLSKWCIFSYISQPNEAWLNKHLMMSHCTLVHWQRYIKIPSFLHNVLTQISFTCLHPLNHMQCP